MTLISVRLFAAAVLAGTVVVSPAIAEDSNFYVKFGSATLAPVEGATIRAGGSVLPGGTIAIKNHTTAGFEVGYNFTPNWNIGFSGGIPPKVDFYGDGSVAGLGKLGSITYGPMALMAQYTFTDLGRIKPYIGGGPLYMFVFNNTDGAVTDLKVKPAFGAVVQAGVDFDVSDHWGLFADVKKAYLRTKATGNLGPAPISADVKLDPWVFGAGLKYRF